MLTPLQVKLGRTAVGLGLRDLAKAAGVAPSTITRFENGRGGMHSGTTVSYTHLTLPTNREV